MLLAVGTRFWRLGTPDDFYFDEIFYAKTGQEILHGDRSFFLLLSVCHLARERRLMAAVVFTAGFLITPD